MLTWKHCHYSSKRKSSCFICCHLFPQCDVTRRRVYRGWSGQQSRDPLKQVSALIKETPEGPSPSFPSPQGRTQNKMRDVYDPGSRPSPDLKSAAALILDFQPSEQHNNSTCSTYCCCCLVAKTCPTVCDPTDCSPPGSSVHGISPGKKMGVACHFLLQGIFPVQGSNLGFLLCRWIYHWATWEGLKPMTQGYCEK